jgi:adenylyltransferase/sulfurtransferase
VSCGEGGILGPVVGVMGVLMAVEAVKIVVANVKPADMAAMRTAKPEPPNQEKQSLLLYSAFGNPPFRSVRLHEKRAHCPSCSLRSNPLFLATPHMRISTCPSIFLWVK